MSSDGSEGWAAGFGGEILRYTNVSWTRFEEASGVTSSSLRALAMSADGTEGFAAGSGGEFLRYADGLHPHLPQLRKGWKNWAEKANS